MALFLIISVYWAFKHSGVLIRLLPGCRAKVRPIKVVVTDCVLLAVLFECCIVAGQCSLSECERLLTVLHSTEAQLRRRFKRLARSEAWLEVHPVLSRIAKRFLPHDLCYKKNYRVNLLFCIEADFHNLDQ